MAELAGKYLQKSKSDPIGVVGFDVAGDEGNFPLNSNQCPMVKGLKRAQELGVPITCHAGEWPEKFNTLQNLRFAIDEIKAQRIGHGIAFRSDLDYCNNVKNMEKSPTIEVFLNFFFFMKGSVVLNLFRFVSRVT